MHELQFRAAQAADIPAIIALVESCYRGEAGRQGWTTESDLLDGQRIDARGVAEALAQVDSVVLLAAMSRRLVACAHVARVDGRGYFGMFAVRTALQGQGIGARVLAEAERRVRADWGCTRMGMTVIDLREELIAWYQRHGYVRSGQYAPFPYGDARYGIPKRDDLRFEWLFKELTEAKTT